MQHHTPSGMHTDLAAAQAEIAQLRRFYAYFSSINHLIIHSKDESTLFTEACRVAVEKGQFRMAWIGILNPDTRVIDPIAYAGEAGSYLDNINIHIDQPERNNGPTGQAFLTGREVYSMNIDTDPKMAPWREKALQHGFLSSISLPIKHRGQVYGVYTMYAGQPDFFSMDEIDLLVNLANDIAFALDVMEAKRSINEYAARLDHLLHAIPDLLWLKDVNGIYLSCNPVFEQYFNVKEADLIGKSDFELVDPELARFFREQDLNALQNNKPTINEEWVTYAPTGEKVLLETIKTPTYTAGNQLLGVLGIARDITERRRNEEKITRLSAAIEQSPVSILIADLTGHIEYANPQFTNLTGYRIEEIPHQNIWSLNSAYQQETDGCSIREQVIQESKWRGVLSNRSKTGELYWESTFITVIQDSNGNPSHILHIMNDRTEEKKYIESIEQKNQKLHDIAWAHAHVIRAPLAKIMGLINLIRFKIPIQTTDQQQLLDLLNSAAHELDAVILDIANKNRE
ncbi:MAG: PAS domain S-box protein [Chitinophagaceae bacterium]|nr:PAS domain S-box protein [Chitinophagaceae bacterium]